MPKKIKLRKYEEVLSEYMKSKIKWIILVKKILSL